MKTARKPATQTAAQIIAAAPDLFDPYAPDDDPLQPDPINWSDEVTNGISLAPSIDRMPGDPPPEACGSPALAGIADLRPEPSVPALTIVAKRSLREHISEADAIADTIEAMDDEDLTEEAKSGLLAMLLAAIAGTKKKVDASNAALSLFEHLETAAICERERLDKRAKYFRRQAQRLTDYLLATMEASRLDRLKGETSTLERKLNPPKVLIADGAIFQHEFLRFPHPPPEPDKDALKKALKAGRKIPGATLVQTARLARS